MSSKVIKWFKRQASIRRFTDKGEETTSTSKSESGEKKKNPFTRLGSFRRKKKKSSDSEDPDSSIVGISKRYSYSVPDEMEAGTKDPSVTIISNSISLENSMSSPSRLDSPTKSSASDLSYHSSYDNEAHSSEFSRDCSPTDDAEVERPPLETDNTCRKKDTLHNGFGSSSKSSSTADAKRRQDVTKGNSIPIIVISQPVTSPGKPPLAAVESYSSDDLSCLSDVEETDVVTSEHGSNENFKEIDRLIEKTQTDLRNSEISCDLENPLAKSVVEECCKTSDNVLSSPDVASKNVCDSNFNSKGDIVVIEMLENIELIIYESDDEKCVAICDSSVIPVTVNTIEEMENNDRSINDNTESINLESLRIAESQYSLSDIKSEENQSPDSFTISTPSSPNSGQDFDASSIDSIDTDSEEDDKETVIDKSTFNQEIDVISLMTNESTDQDDNISAKIECQNDINEKLEIEDIENKVESVNEYESIKCEQEIEDIHKVESIQVHNVLSEEKICQQNVEDSEVRDEVKETCDLFTVDKNENKVLSVSDNNDLKKIEECNKDAKVRNQDVISDIVCSEIKVKEKSKQETEQKTIFGKTQCSDVNEIKDFRKEICVENVNNKSIDLESNDTINYPVELNPFDSDDENICNNSKSTVYHKEKENDTKEKGSNPFGSDTEIEEEYNKHMRQSQTRLQIHDKDFCRVSTENLNDLSSRQSGNNSPHQSHSRRKYDGSNDNKASMKSHFSVEDLTSRIDYRPNLPPKTEKRKNSSGSLVPTPRPRKSKLHGSTTSLQNISSLFPVAAPRSITPCGSTRTLNETSTNPFADDMDDDEEDTSSGIFDRRGCGRNTVQDSSATGVSFARNNRDRGSLPPSSRGRKKKRPAPAPPSGVLSNKPPKPVGGVHASRRSPSLDASSKKFTPTKINSPFRPAPPRPPPPRI